MGLLAELQLAILAALGYPQLPSPPSSPDPSKLD